METDKPVFASAERAHIHPAPTTGRVGLPTEEVEQASTPSSATVEPDEPTVLYEQQCSTGEETMNESLVADGSGRTVILGQNGSNDCRGERFLLQQGFQAAADRDIVNIVRDSSNRTQDVVHTTAAATQLAVEKTAAAAALQASELASRALVAATKDAAANLAAIEKCCCDLKELTRAEAGQTRDLINANRSADLVAALTAAQNEINLLKIRFPTIPV